MLLSANLPKGFWGEAINTAVYLINRCQSAALNFKVLEEVWNGVAPDYRHLKSVWLCGLCLCQAIKCMFVGYPNGVKGYKLCFLREVCPRS